MKLNGLKPISYLNFEKKRWVYFNIVIDKFYLEIMFLSFVLYELKKSSYLIFNFKFWVFKGYYVIRLFGSWKFSIKSSIER